MDQRPAPNLPHAAWLAAIVDSSDDAIVSKTLGGVITSWNAGAERIFGYTADEAVGRHITLIIPTERWPEETEVLARIARGERVDHFETVRRRKDGRLLAISLTVSPIKDADGRIVGASKVARDVTERKALEEERRQLLAREQEARAEAERANRSKDEFLAVLSHELRTPLNAIYGWARMLQGQALDGAALRQAADAIVRNAAAQVRLVDDLLDVSRIITGNMRLDVRPVDLKVVVEAALDTVRPAMDAKGIQLQAVLDSRTGAVMGAADRLQQVVWNLVMNAVKFTPKGGRVQVTLRRGRSHVEVVVSDSGEGIAPDLLPFVFDRFRQGNSSSSRTHGGLGIGLAIVRHLVELHGGSVRAQSPGLGQGATFTVALPVALASVAAPAERPDGAGTDGPGDVPLRGLRVLVVDDDSDSVDVARIILSASGAEVRTASAADVAFALFREWRPHVLVSDIEMPGEDGFALLRRVRDVEAAGGRRTPALALTAYGRPEDRIRTLAAGFNLHIAKPVDPTELTLSIASLAGLTG
jgi:PAS domain S-box-containing protein